MPAAGLSAKTDLNSASLEEIKALPISEELALRIVDYRTFLRYFDNVYDLLEVEGLTNDDLARLKPLVATLPPKAQDASIARLSAGYRQVQQYLGQEGSSEGLSDEYLEKMRSPENLNEMDLFDLMSYQNVSPVDATNILKARDRLGKFENARQLRGAEGLRYYSYRNLRDFVVYGEDEMQDGSRRPVSGYAQTRYYETPFSNSDDEIGSFATGAPRGRYTVDQKGLYQPGWLNKVRVHVKGGYQGGLLANREYGEKNWDETAKGFAGVTDRRFGDFRLKSLYVGDYRVAYGLGLVMDNTDFIHFRKTGYGFNKRLLGVHGDLSRSHEYAPARAGCRGLLRPDQRLLLRLQRPQGRHPQSRRHHQPLRGDAAPARGQWLDGRVTWTSAGVRPPSAIGLRRDAFQEDILGGNVKVMLAPGTFVGLTRL